MKSSQRLTRFAFGAAASFDAFSVSVLPGTSVEAVAAEQRSKLENQGGVPLQNLQTQLLQENSMTWSESRFEAAVNGERRLLLQRVALVADEAVVLQVSTFPELEETLAPVLREAIGSFQSVPRTERELAVASHLEHGRETKVHRGTAAPYTLTAGALWSPISVPLGSPYDLLLQLGNGDHAWVGVVCEPRDAFSDQVDAEAIAGVMIEAIRSANSDSFELRGHDWIQFAGQRSLRLRYSIALFGNRLQFTNHILLHPRYVFQCVGFTDFESADAHDNALSPALNGFRLPASTEGR